ncbi:TniQ family protein [Undibacterium sp. BYS107W]|uniref:TniQ family protein n=1 Tax=Undibacterium baiyunense TaxID=2828731 RepID=A0A941I1H9_9BURK|nr:TniQ family protein [Undibacterium baiyunense]
MSLAWCWRDDWITGYDSAYGLFAKFARLNSMGARELASLFVNRQRGSVTSILHAPKIDLRSSEFFDLTIFAKHLRLDQKAIQQAFLIDQLPNRGRHSCNVLRWCPRCAHRGFHSAVFQLDLISACPIHNLLLRAKCPKCRRQIPYQLSQEIFDHPFCCPWCENDLAPELRRIRPQVLTLKSEETTWIENLVSLLIFEDEMVSIRLEINRARKQLGIGEFAVAHADWRRLESEYIGFVKQVVDIMQTELNTSQQSLELGALSFSVKRPHGGGQPLPKKTYRRKATHAIEMDKQNSAHVKMSWDQKLRGSYDVYNGVRRYLWRHVVHQHHRCIARAVKHLWWNMDGESTCSFCPIAEAFIRWRIHWELCGTPQYLFSPMRKDPLGLVAWMASGAPICPVGWTIEAERWVSDNLLGSHCFGSFWEFFEIALKNSKRNRVDWDKHAYSGRYTSYWAIAGSDTLKSPVRIYKQVHTPNEIEDELRNLGSDRHHFMTHLSQLSKIVR